MCYVVVASDDSLYRQLLEQLPTLLARDYLWVLLSRLVYCIKNGCEASLMTCVIIIALILNKVLALLIDRIVSQMHTEVV